MAYEYKREPLNSDEVGRLTSAAATGEDRLVVWGLLETGLRIAEFSSLTKDSIDFQTHRISVLGKGKKRRIVPISMRLRETLEGYLIANEKMRIGTRQIQRVITKLARRAKIKRPVSPHVLRHTFAVRALREGISLPALMRLLGHSNLQTTAIYLNLAPEDVIEEFNKKW